MTGGGMDKLKEFSGIAAGTGDSTKVDRAIAEDDAELEEQEGRL